MNKKLKKLKNNNPPHPIQPLYIDEDGIKRFKPNSIVRHLLDHGGLSMNDLVKFRFPREDWEQFAQLINYSHSGAGDLSYMSTEVWEAADTMYENGLTKDAAMASNLKEELDSLREELREPIARLYGLHPDDLKSR